MHLEAESERAIDITFVVIAYNEEKYLPCCLASIAAQQTALAGEIILIDDRSIDNTVGVARQYPARIFVSETKSDVIGMRNLGLAQARGTAIIFVDADVAFSPNYVEEMARPITTGEVDITLCGAHFPLEAKFPIFPENRSKSYGWYLSHMPDFILRKNPIRPIPWCRTWMHRMREERRYISPHAVPDRVNTPAIAVRTTIARRFGGWRQSFGTHEDTRYCLDAFAMTNRVRWSFKAQVYYSYRRFYPQGNEWILQKLLPAPIRKLVWRQQLRTTPITEADAEQGYVHPEGVR